MALLIISIILIAFILYKRYFPITDVPFNHLKDLDLEYIKVIDLRDFNVSYKDPVKEALNIPIAYLKRNHHEIPDMDLHVVASSLVEKNMGIRLLRQQGFHVISFNMIEQNNIQINTLNYCK
ncbi:hypothetical protein [Bacillus tuaregi]|uniref:hypothetical protein n=1 Tax=Bacillus tuaregi TaxID=1816695 RepID=UPI0008F8828F|nr:hypothetical protein [Bacillus tuaregi]